MRKFIFKKANYLLKDTKLIAESEHQIIFQVGKYQVILKYHKHKLIGLCSCKAGSLNTFCSHICAAITKLTNDT
jgi:hypothetical protein